MLRRLLGTLLLVGCASSPSQDPRNPAAFAQWRAANEIQVAAYEGFLRTQGLAELVPLHELLRSASDWQKCQAQPFAVPPEAQWPDAASVLRLLADLKAEGILRRFEVHSGFRNAELNACAGGAARSAHLRAFAVDLTPSSPPTALAELCSFWRTRGRERNLGLGQYPSGRIHLDTVGYRTWGVDGSARSSPCQTQAQASS